MAGLAGFSAFMISWNEPNNSDISLTIFLQGVYNHSIYKMINLNKVNTLGCYIGGTLQALSLSYLERIRKE